MKRIFTLLILNVTLFFSVNALDISGTIAVDSVWTKADSPYIIDGTLRIAPGATLTIDSAVVLFKINSGIRVDGNLIANITDFSSNQPSPEKGDWNGLEFRTGSNGDFKGCKLLYGGYASSNIGYGILSLTGGSVVLDSTAVYNSSNTGIVVQDGSNLEIKYKSSVTSNVRPIVYQGRAHILFDHTDIEIDNNYYNGVYVNFGNLYHDMVLDTLNVPYVFNSSLTVRNGANLEIASDNVLKFNDRTSLDVYGGLRAIAANDGSSVIHFTSIRNDNLGGDTNNDGTATIPASRNWGYVMFRDESDDAYSHLERCEFSYGGYGNHGVVFLQNSSPTVDSCDFRNNYIGCKMQGDCQPDFTNNLIGSSGLVPLALTFDAHPNFVNNEFSFSDNEYDAIGLLETTLVRSATLPQRDVTGIPNVTYLMLGRVTIPEGMSLTIEEGIVLKGRNHNDRFIVEGELIMDCTDETSRITITSVEDDNFGNPADTNKDGTSTQPAIGDWGGIMFESTSDAGNCLLDYCRFQYARMPSTRYSGKYISGGTVSMENADPVITNCVIKDCDYGVYAFQSSNPTVQNNDFVNINYTPIALSVSAFPTFGGNTFTNEGWTALGIIGEELGFNGTINKRDIAGHTNITYALLENLTVNSGTELDIQPGVVVKMNRNVGVYVNGGFKAEGLASDSIVFTSINDDNYGVPKDTRKDGDAQSPSAGDWYTIRYNATSDDAYNLIKYCKLLYGGGNNYGIVTYTDAGGVISHTKISDSHYYGLKFEGIANPDCGGAKDVFGEYDGTGKVNISNSRLDPVAMSLTSDPQFSFFSPYFLNSGNGSNGIYILEGNLNVSTTVHKKDVGDIYNVAYIVDNLTIGENAVLSLDPGVVIKFRDYNSYIVVNGALVADGLMEEPIVFTSFKDDSKGGDTNGDGNTTIPGRNDWRFVKFNSSAQEGQNLLQNCVLNYGGRSTSWSTGKNRSVVIVSNSYANIDSCSIEHCQNTALGIFGSSDPDVTNNVITNVGEVPVILSMFANPVFADNKISNIGLRAIGVAEETYALDGTVPQRNFAGINNITYYIYRDCTVNEGTTITIPAGTVFKSNNQTKFTVDGALEVNGTSENPVVFTDYRDDAYGNPSDTNDDGTLTAPTIGSYPAIIYSDVSLDALSGVENTIFRYHSSGIRLEQASPDIQNNLFNYCDWGVTLKGVSEPIINNNTFRDLTYAPLYLSLVSYPVSPTGNIIEGTTYKAIGVLANEELVQDVTLERKDFATVENIPYYFHGNYSIGTSVVLSINPGVVCKFNRNSALTVKRGLMAIGKEGADSTIVFTDIRDDFYQGDTNSDGNDSKPTDSYPWYGIVFADESFDDYCQLDYCVVRYAGRTSSHAAITAQTASPTITNSSLTRSMNGVRATGASNPVINFCDISGNRYYGVENVNMTHDIDATNNFWGNDTGPTHVSNPGGTGDEITDRVLWDPYLTGGYSLPVMGDVSLNGEVQAYDASLVLQYEVDPVANPLSSTQQSVADVNDDTFINSTDASDILQYVAGLIQTFDAELKSANGNEYTFDIERVNVGEGSVFNIPVHVNNSRGLRALGTSVVFSPDVIEVQGVSLSVGASALLASHVDNQNGTVRVAMAAKDAISNDGVAFILNVKAKGTVGDFTTVELTDLYANDQKTDVFVDQGSVEIGINTGLNLGEVTGVKVHPVFPNPADDFFKLAYAVKDENSYVNIGLYQMSGLLVKQIVNDYQSGGNYIINVNDIDDLTGTYVLKVVIDNTVVNQKLIIK